MVSGESLNTLDNIFNRPDVEEEASPRTIVVDDGKGSFVVIPTKYNGDAVSAEEADRLFRAGKIKAVSKPFPSEEVASKHIEVRERLSNVFLES